MDSEYTPLASVVTLPDSGASESYTTADEPLKNQTAILPHHTLRLVSRFTRPAKANYNSPMIGYLSI